MSCLSMKFGPTLVEIYPNSTKITFGDGMSITGAPENTDDYRNTAVNNGYGNNTLKMCQDHELMHVALCHWLGIESPTMQLLRSNDDNLHTLNRLEEKAVLAIQHFAQASGINLLIQMEKWSKQNVEMG